MIIILCLKTHYTRYGIGSWSGDEAESLMMTNFVCWMGTRCVLGTRYVPQVLLALMRDCTIAGQLKDHAPSANVGQLKDHAPSANVGQLKDHAPSANVGQLKDHAPSVTNSKDVCVCARVCVCVFS